VPTPQQNKPNEVNVPDASGGFHEPTSGHKHEGLTFSYPTVGIPVPGKTYNSTKVAPEDLLKFDDEINALLKPYNVTLL
jgi:hypothetical protein